MITIHTEHLASLKRIYLDGEYGDPADFMLVVNWHGPEEVELKTLGRKDDDTRFTRTVLDAIREDLEAAGVQRARWRRYRDGRLVWHEMILAREEKTRHG